MLSTGTAFTLPSNRRRYSVESDMTTSTFATGFAPVTNDNFRSGLLNFKQAETDLTFDLINDLDNGQVKEEILFSN